MVNQTHADEISIACIVQLYERVKYLENGVGPKVTSKQIHNLRKTWSRFTAGDNDAAGLKMFLKMFEQKPELKKHFEFARDTASQQMQSSSRMIFHVSRVAWHIGEVLDKMETLEDVVPVLKQVGSRHNPKGYNIPTTAFPFLGTALITCMKTSNRDFTHDDEHAWKELFGWIIGIMIQGMNECKTV